MEILNITSVRVYISNQQEYLEREETNNLEGLSEEREESQVINLQKVRKLKQDAETTTTDDTTEYQGVKSVVQPSASEWRQNSVGFLGC